MKPRGRRTSAVSVLGPLLPAVISCLLMLAPGQTVASEGGMRLDREKVMRSNGFLNFHPDILNRHRGFEALSQQRAEEALGHLKRAARFADKASQAVIAELYFKGEGVPQDRALGYAWMDLAAERGWQGFLALREHYWAQLDDSERKRAIEVGQGVYAEYEDAVAKPRLEAQLRRGRREMTGSRIGSPGALKIIYGDDVIGVRVRLDERGLGSSSVPGHLYYADEFWLPEAYWEWQAQVWDRPLRGLVDVLPLQRAEP